MAGKRWSRWVSNALSRAGMRLFRFGMGLDAATPSENRNTRFANAKRGKADEVYTRRAREDIATNAQYAYDNNSVLSSVIHTHANLVIGTGPSTRFTIHPMPGLVYPERASDELTNDYAWWMFHDDTVRKLIQIDISKNVRGEVFVYRTRGAPDPRNGIELSFQLIEGDRCVTPDKFKNDPMVREGIRFNALGVPVGYYIRPDGDRSGSFREAEYIEAEHIRHIFARERPGQTRGVSQVRRSIDLVEQLRDYEGALVNNAMLCAKVMGFIQSNYPEYFYQSLCSLENQKELERLIASRGTPGNIQDLRGGEILTLHDGDEFHQFKPENASGSYAEFRKGLISAIGLELGMPYVLSALDSSDANMAAGRLDQFQFNRRSDILRAGYAKDPLEWMEQSYVAEWLPRMLGLPHVPDRVESAVRWPGYAHPNPQQVAAADRIYDEMGVFIEEDHFVSRGIDPQEAYRKLADQDKRRRARYAAQEAKNVNSGDSVSAAKEPKEEEYIETTEEDGGILNGSQATVLLDIVSKSVSGEISRESAVEILVTVYRLSREEARRIVFSDTESGSGIKEANAA